MPIDCRVVDRALVIRDSTGRPLWEGRVDGLDALDAAPLGETCAVLLDWSQVNDRRFLNLVCVAQTGAILWRAEMPTNAREEVYTKISVQGDALVAWSFFGLMVHLDPETGRIRWKQFVG